MGNTGKKEADMAKAEAAKASAAIIELKGDIKKLTDQVETLKREGMKTMSVAYRAISQLSSAKSSSSSKSN